jgi:HEAT repeat protein
MTTLHNVPTTQLLEQAVAAAHRDVTREAEDRWNIIRELHRRGEEATRDAAFEWCASPEPLVRCLGADVLGQLGYTETSHPYAGQSEPVLVAMLEDPDETVLACAIVALGHLGSGDTAAIASYAGHRSSEVREAVAFSLAKRDEPVAHQTLVRLSTDDDAEVRNWSTFGLGTLGGADSPVIREALAARLSDQDDEVRGEAMRGLAARGDARAIPAILEEIEQDQVMDLAIEAAALLPDTRFLPALEELFEQLPDSADLRIAVERCREI